MIYYEIQQLMEMLFIAGLIIIHPLGYTLNKIPLAFRFIWKHNTICLSISLCMFIWTQIKIYIIFYRYVIANYKYYQNMANQDNC
mgnify:CR=1 FL=1